MKQLKGIDVSVYNGTIDWQKVKNAGVDFAILRAGYGQYADQRDPSFETNYAGARSVGIPVGAYWFSYAVTPDDAQLEAKTFLEVIKGKQFEYPVAYDIEDRQQAMLGRDTIDAIINSFCKYLEERKYYVALYSYEDFLLNNVSEATRDKYCIWVADVGAEPALTHKIWQYSFSGRVNGIPNSVDLDRTSTDFPSIMRYNGLNGITADKPTTKPPVPEKPETTDRIYQITLKEGTWYYHSGPSMDTPNLGTVSGGYKYNCTKVENGWYYCPPMGGWFGPAAIKSVEILEA